MNRKTIVKEGMGQNAFYTCMKYFNNNILNM